MSGPRLTLLLADGTVLHTKEEGKVGRGDVQSASPSSTKTAQGQLMKISRCQLHLTARDDAWHVTCAGGNPSLLDRYDCEPILLSKGVEHELQNGDVLWLLAEACSMATSGPSTAEGAEDHKQFGPLVIFLEPAEPSAPPSGSGPVVRMALERPAITMEQGVPASAVTGVSRPTPMAEHSAACAAARSWLEERRLRDGSFLVCNVSCQSDRAAEFRLDPRRRDGTLVLECERPLPTSVLVDRPAGALSIRWCDGVETFGTHVPQIPWAQLPHQSGDLHAEVRSTFYSGAREVSVRRRTDKGGIGPFRIDPLASPHERHGAPPGEATCGSVTFKGRAGLRAGRPGMLYLPEPTGNVKLLCFVPQIVWC